MKQEAGSLFELTTRVKAFLGKAFSETTWIIAEIAELKTNASGHCYLELVEKDLLGNKIVARARATIWAYTFRILKPYFETTAGRSFSAGLRVMMNVSVEFHELYGFSLNVHDIDPAYTMGDMARQRAETIERLKNEGVLNMNRELILPLVPQRLAIISSETAAGYEDFIDQLRQNEFGYSFAHHLFPALMQGEEAGSSIISALEKINNHLSAFDVVIIIRGGGAVADLHAFDDYWMACHVAQFPLPVLTGIGHEKDDSVVDLVAHTRLKTPTAVADFLITQFSAFEENMLAIQNNMIDHTRDKIILEKERLFGYTRLLSPLASRLINEQHRVLQRKVTVLQVISNRGLARKNETLTKSLNRLQTGIKLTLHKYRFKNSQALRDVSHFANQILRFNSVFLEQALNTVSLSDPRNLLKRGYSITFRNGKVVHSILDAEPGTTLKTLVSDGEINSQVSFLKDEKSENHTNK